MQYYRLERDGEICWKQLDPFGRGDPPPEGALVVSGLPRDEHGNLFADVADWNGSEWVLGDGTALDEAGLALRARKVAMHAAVKAMRDRIEWAGCSTPYGPIDTDPDSQRKVSGGSAAAPALGAAFAKDWRMADDTIVALDATKMIEVGLLGVAHVDACQQRKNALDAPIAAAYLIQDLDAIDIETGWPS